MLPEARMHPAVCALVASFFRSVFADEQYDPIAQFNSAGLASLDPALRIAWSCMTYRLGVRVDPGRPRNYLFGAWLDVSLFQLERASTHGPPVWLRRPPDVFE